MSKYDLVVYIGRFEPRHVGHEQTIQNCLKLSNNIQIIIGSINKPRDKENPFTYEERRMLMDKHMAKISVDKNIKYQIAGVEDFYSNTEWVAAVANIVTKNFPNAKSICVVGTNKDESSYYERMFPQWKYESLPVFTKFIDDKEITATKIRELYFEKRLGFLSSVVSEDVFNFLSNFSKTEEYINLCNEYEYFKEYDKIWSVTPHPVNFITVDAVVIKAAHVLMVKRKSAPGKGLWALPGGFLNQNETALEGCLRELKEETGIDVPPRILLSSVKHEKLFDSPKRSLRKRTLTQAYLIQLIEQNPKLPKVKGRDDAEKAKWFHINEIFNMGEQIFEDHLSIIKYMYSKCDEV